MFSEELKKLRKQRSLTQQKLADALGISKSTISMYENGNREPDFETSEAIADYFNVRLDDLLGRKNSFSSNIPNNLPNNIIPIPKMKKIPLIGTIACGEPILATENIDSYIGVDENSDATFALRCKGDSMITARIFDGDVVYIRPQPDVENGEIAAVLIGNDATLKKVYKAPNKVTLSPCNPMYSDLVYTDEQLNEIKILGKAVAFTSVIR